METEFEVRGQHETHLEHSAEAGESLAQRIAVVTAVLATIGAVFAYAGGARQNEAMLLKNEAILKKSEAADQWAYFQSKSQKQALAEFGRRISSGDTATEFARDAERYQAEKQAIQKQAEALDEESKRLNEASEHTMEPHHRFAKAMTAVQISIALASVAALTRKRWMVGFALFAAGIGTVLGVSAWLMG